MARSEPRVGEEIRKMEAEPLLPVEKRLIAWSLILGVIGLFVLVWVSYTFFPAQTSPPTPTSPPAAATTPAIPPAAPSPAPGK